MVPNYVELLDTGRTGMVMSEDGADWKVYVSDEDRYEYWPKGWCSEVVE